VIGEGAGTFVLPQRGGEAEGAEKGQKVFPELLIRIILAVATEWGGKDGFCTAEAGTPQRLSEGL